MMEGRFELSDTLLEQVDEEIKRQYPELEDFGEEQEENAEDEIHGYGEQVQTSPVKGMETIMLIGPGSGSAADSMAAEAKHAGVTLLGTTTRGATGNVMIVNAGGSWSVSLSTKRSLTPDGKEINNHGIEPDIFLEQKEEDTKAGRDTLVHAAMELLLEQKVKE